MNFWLLSVISASLLWGISYAASEHLLSRGFSPPLLFFLQAALGCLAGAVILLARGRLGLVGPDLKPTAPDWMWLVVASGSATAAALLILFAVAARNAPVTALIEISYPLPTAFFCWLFFRQSHLNWQVAAGAVLIITGVIVVMAGSSPE